MDAALAGEEADHIECAGDTPIVHQRSVEIGGATPRAWLEPFPIDHSIRALAIGARED